MVKHATPLRALHADDVAVRYPSPGQRAGRSAAPSGQGKRPLSPLPRLVLCVTCLHAFEAHVDVATITNRTSRARLFRFPVVVLQALRSGLFSFAWAVLVGDGWRFCRG